MLMGLCAYAQDKESTLKGRVTFITSKNVYIKFENTEVIKIGDTLKTINNIACLLVTNKSSNSIVSSKIGDCVIEKGMHVLYSLKSQIEAIIEEETIVENIGINFNDSIQSISKNTKKEYSEDIRARLSASSYSTISEIREDRHRLMTRFALNANHINYSKLSIETYLNYRYNVNSEGVNTSNNDNALRVFNLALRYDIDPTLSITAGRKINYKISSLGAIDGVQAEKFLGNNYIGAIAGFRPDIFDFGFNPNLFQYGAYVGRLTENENLYSQTTLGLAEQLNNNDLDRRFAYFQHASTINKNLNLFATAELDVFNQQSDSISNGAPRLTNLFMSARYRFNRKVNLALSYDSRKRLIYYKTYETSLEELLDEDIARQGIRARLNIKPLNGLFSGFSYSKRFQSDSQNKSENIYGYLSFSKLPIDGRISLTYNMNSSNYLDSNIASLRYSRTFMDDRLSTDFYYRFVNYKYVQNVPDFSQHYIGTYLSYYLDRSLIISLSGEYSTYNQENNFRINTRIIKRFYRKRKK
jgi:hypothetical protein